MIVIIQLNLFRKKWVFILLVLNIERCIFLVVLLVNRIIFFIDKINKLFYLEFTVGPIQGGGAHKVRASGNGLVRGEVHSTSTSRKTTSLFYTDDFL
jgi:hypothetical protein